MGAAIRVVQLMQYVQFSTPRLYAQVPTQLLFADQYIKTAGRCYRLSRIAALTCPVNGDSNEPVTADLTGSTRGINEDSAVTAKNRVQSGGCCAG